MKGHFARWLEAFSPSRFVDVFCDELQRSPALRWLITGLAAFHLLTLLWWKHDFEILSHTNAICWPFFPSCQLLRPWSQVTILATATLYGLSATAVFLFQAKRQIRYVWWALLVTELFKLMFFLQDYRFMGNYHYMLFWVSFVVLFLHHKAEILPSLIALFYLAAGALKLNREWLSGAALGAMPIWGQKLLVPFQGYAVFIETVITLLFFSRSTRWFYFAMANFILFHALSYVVVGYYYPAVSFVFLAFLMMIRSERSPLAFPRTYGANLILVAFIVAQVPFHTFSANGALDGRGRLFALNMFDSYSQCQSFGFAQQTGGEWTEVSYSPTGLFPRIQCDPIVMRNHIRATCRQRPGTPDQPETISMTTFSRRSTDLRWLKIIDLKAPCSTASHLSLWPEAGSSL